MRLTKVGKLFKCTTCKYKSELKKNVVLHIKTRCPDIRKERNNNKECPICQQTFVRKSNRDRHMRNVHVMFTEYDENETSLPSFANNIDFQGELLSESMEYNLPSIKDNNSVTPELEVSFIAPTFILNEDIEFEDGVEDESTVSTNTIDTFNVEMKIKPSRFCLQSILDKLKNNAEEIRSLDEKYQNAFLDKILEKLKEDIKSKNLKRTAFEFLYDAFGSMLVENKDFVY